MKLKLTLERSGREDADLVVTVDATATVSDVAGALLHKDPEGLQSSWAKYGGPLALTIVSPGLTELAPDTAALDGGLLSGCRVRVSRPTKAAPDERPAATVRIVGGPGKGKEISIPPGTAVVGRAAGCAVRLSDAFVSREHVQLRIGETAEVVDLGSANGVEVAGERVPRAVLRPDDVVRIGDTSFTVALHGRGARGTGTREFNRSPRLDPSYEGQSFVVPDPPQAQQRQRFPFLPLIAPLIFGAILFAVTRSPTSLIFVALSPVLMLANAVESRTANKRAYTQSLKQWREDLAALRTDIETAAEREGEQRRRERPSGEESAQAVVGLLPLVWCRRPGRERHLDLRLGRADLPTRSTIELPDGRHTTRALQQEAAAAVAPSRVIAQVPVPVALADGALGIAGDRRDSLGVARALLLQVAALHSPAEVVVAAFASSQSAGAWSWLAWLPHVDAPQSPIEGRHLAANPAAATALAAELRRVVDERAGQDSVLGPSVVVLVEDDAPFLRSALVDIAARGPAVGVHLLWSSSAVAGLPSVCTTYLWVRPGGHDGEVGTTLDGRSVTPVAVEPVSADDALEAALGLAPLVDSGAMVDDATDLPRSVSWLALHDPELATSPPRVIEQWAGSGSLLTGPYAPAPGVRRPKGSLRAVLGQNAGERHVLDLRTQGPHALVGGTTGSGKSELLQSWILGLAAAHSPQRVSFLLIDYKGGAAFKDCVSLPHTVGLVTDLSPHLVRRALTSLRAELRYRERFLARHRAKDLLEVEEKGVPDSPPSLVIVVDEFAALVQEVPEFVDGMVDVAQRGRSLGLHLILATQRPAGVIKDNLRANTNLRLALRVADEGDSTDVLGSPAAASFDPDSPGRAVSKTGPGRLTMFQAAYAGGFTSGEIPPPVVDIEELAFGAGVVWTLPDDGTPPPEREDGPTDIQRVVETVVAAALEAQIPAPRKPWLPELAPAYELANLPTERRDDRLVFGVRDDPESQTQPTVAFHPDAEGNLVVYGTGGSGKSTLLRSLAVAAGFTVRGGPCQVYGLDFGARGLSMLSDLPHVGSIIDGSDDERVVRLLRWLRSEIDDRATRWAAVKAGTITQYRRLAKDPDIPRILLLVDGIAAFRQSYDSTERLRWLDLFTGIAGEGRQVGVHLILASETRSGMWPALASSVQSRVVLRMADVDDYGLMGMARDVLDGDSPAGRALLGDDEVQVGVLGGSPDVTLQALAMTRFAAAVRRAGKAEADPIRSLPDVIPLAELPLSLEGLPVLGLADDSLAPVGFEPRGSFLVSGPPSSGRTTTLRTLAYTLRRADPERALYYVGNERSDLGADPIWHTAATTPEGVVALVAKLTAELGRRSRAARVALVVEGMADFVNTPVDMQLQAVVKLALDRDHLVVFEGESSQLSMSSVGLAGYAKSSRAGLALQPEQSEGTPIFRTAFPRVRRADFPYGRGLLVARGRTTVVQVALS